MLGRPCPRHDPHDQHKHSAPTQAPGNRRERAFLASFGPTAYRPAVRLMNLQQRSDASMKTDHREVALGKVIRRARARAGLSQTKLAERIGSTFQQIQKYERGTNRIRVTILLDLSYALGTTPEALLREHREVLDEPQTPNNDAGPEDRDAVRLMGLAHQVDEPTRKAVIDLLSACVK